MNILEFKALTESEYYKDSLSLFRNWMILQYNSFLKDKEISYARNKHEYLESHFYLNNEDMIEAGYYDVEFPSLKFQWDYFSFYGATEIYSKMGWALDDYIEKIKIEHHEESDSLYIDYGAEKMFSKVIETCKDVAEFFYAIVLMKNYISDMSDREGLYILKDNILKGLQQFKLINLASQIVKGNDVFIAMSFSTEMKSTRECIKNTLNELKFNPVFIDEKQHNNQIPEEIFFEIDKSLFVIADLTEQKGGVYLEAGYAMAKKKSVIFTCNKLEEKIIHFDVKQINTILWENEDDLKKRLKSRIQATIQNKE